MLEDVVIISDLSELTATFDWLEFTVKHITLKALITGILRLNNDSFKNLEHGRFGYNSQLKWNDGNLFILFNAVDQQPIENDIMGLHILITGTGCRAYETLFGLRTLILLVIGAVPDSKFTRIDLAIDDFNDEIINYQRIHEAAINGTFTSRWNKWDELNSRCCADGKLIGRTMYFGSQKSDIFVRIYDKTLERLAKSDTTDIPEAWTRLEMVYKKERAQLLAYHLVDNENIGIILRETLNHYIRFLEPSQVTDRNKSRWPTVLWWQELLGDVGQLSLTVSKLDRTIDEMEHWVDRQIAPTIAAIMTAKGGELNWLTGIVVAGQQRLRAKHQDAIKQYAVEQQTKEVVDVPV